MTAPPTADPLAEITTEITTVWSELLDLPPAEIPHDVGFLVLGGDSVLAVRMSALIRARLGVALGLAEVRVDTTVGEIAALVADRVSDPSSGSLPSITHRRADPHAPFPLLPLQQGYFVGQQDGWELSYASAHYYVDYPLDGIDGDEAAEALADALERLARRQPGLRARVDADGRQYVLPVEAPGAVPTPTVLDLRDAAPEEIETRLAALRDLMNVSGPDPTSGPGLDVRLTLLPGDAGLLHGAFSLLLFDGWSAGVLTRELLALAQDWNAVLAPLEIDPGDYVGAVGALRGTRGRNADRDWWWERIDALPAPPALPLVVDPQEITPTVMQHREFRLDPARWAALRAACRDQQVTPATALLTAFSVVLARWAGHRRMLLNSLQTGRLPLHPDVHRMIGGFATTMLLPVVPETGRSFAELARTVQRTFAEHAAHMLVPGVEVAREVGRRRGTHRPVAPVVFQSTIGMDAAMGSPLPTEAGPLGRVRAGDYTHHLRTPQVALETRCFEIDEQLVLVFSLVAELFVDDEVTGAFGELVELATALADGPGWDAVPELPEALDPVPGEGLRIGALPGTGRTHAPGPPADGAEQVVAEVFEDFLEIPVLDRTVHFFTAGGDSLLAIRVLARLAAELDHPVPVRDFLADPTVAGVAAAGRGA